MARSWALFSGRFSPCAVTEITFSVGLSVFDRESVIVIVTVVTCQRVRGGVWAVAEQEPASGGSTAATGLGL